MELPIFPFVASPCPPMLPLFYINTAIVLLHFPFSSLTILCNPRKDILVPRICRDLRFGPSVYNMWSHDSVTKIIYLIVTPPFIVPTQNRTHCLVYIIRQLVRDMAPTKNTD
eukprot:TRINITY_DN24021_c0_g1_i1.p1 TRINITY_DN24021_c0_g1~~TRINITY_DN24021_c0_g1_i1.p1  ORF type:complete len:112 (-),score=5.37 TRINITY_DN24021_c0_g1_i1:435-770(-)